MISRYLPSDSKMGVGFQVHALANAMVGRGHEVTVFSQSSAVGDAHYTLHRVVMRPPLRSLRASWHLRWVDWSHFDVLHAHGDDWFLWSKKVPPHVRTIHGSCLAEAANITGIKSKLYMLFLACLETLSCFVADKTVAVSSNTCRSYPWIKTVIPNGVDVAAYAAAQPPGSSRPLVSRISQNASRQASPAGQNDSESLPDDAKCQRPYPECREATCRGKAATPAILFVGTYHNRKRGKLLMDVFARSILPRLPEAQLWMVCSDAPAAPGVTVFGRVSQEKLITLYQQAWAFCLPSTYEGFGIPYIEAMAAGTAVVASPNVGAVEVTRNGQDGLIAADDKLGDTLLNVLMDENLRQKLEAAGLERVKDFDLNSVCQRYENIYAAVAAKRDRAAKA